MTSQNDKPTDAEAAQAIRDATTAIDEAQRERDAAIETFILGKHGSWAEAGKHAAGPDGKALSRRAVQWALDRQVGRRETEKILATSAGHLPRAFPWLKRLSDTDRARALAELKAGAEAGDVGPAWVRWRDRAGRIQDSKFSRGIE